MLEHLIYEYKRIKSLRLMLEEKAGSSDYLSSCSFSAMPGGSSLSDPTAFRAVRHVNTGLRLAEIRSREQDAKEAVRGALAALEDPVIVNLALLHFYEGLSWSETAGRLQMKTSAVKMRWKRFHDRETVTPRSEEEVTAG